jgi:hypothetical protein
MASKSAFTWLVMMVSDGVVDDCVCMFTAVGSVYHLDREKGSSHYSGQAPAIEQGRMPKQANPTPLVTILQVRLPG